MNKAVLINACLRGEQSRTKRLADGVLAALADRYVIDEIDLTAAPLPPLDAAAYQRRQEGCIDPLALSYARRLAQADLVVVAMPFWDMSFPSVFKVFCEQVTLDGVTFHADETGFHGDCRAQRILLITTRGMELEDGHPLEQGSSYIKAIGWLWGIPEVLTVSAIGMDMVDEATALERVDAAIQKGRALCERL